MCIYPSHNPYNGHESDYIYVPMHELEPVQRSL